MDEGAKVEDNIVDNWKNLTIQEQEEKIKSGFLDRNFGEFQIIWNDANPDIQTKYKKEFINRAFHYMESEVKFCFREFIESGMNFYGSLRSFGFF